MCQNLCPGKSRHGVKQSHSYYKAFVENDNLFLYFFCGALEKCLKSRIISICTEKALATVFNATKGFRGAFAEQCEIMIISWKK